MRIVIDMQGAQTESRYRGIGRYTMAFAQAVVRNHGNHEVILALSGLFPETIEPIRAAFEGLLPQENIRVWYAPGPVKEDVQSNHVRRQIAEMVREAFLASLEPDVIHVTSLFEGYVDDAVTSIGVFDSQTPVSVIIYDLIPLLNSDQYLKSNPAYAAFYERKLKFLKDSQMLLAISAYSREEAIGCLGIDAAQVINISTAISQDFKLVQVGVEVASVLCRKFGIKHPFVLYSGGADERKNLPRLIEAWSALPTELRHSHQLLFAGRMPEGSVAKLKKIAHDHGLQEDELIFSGYVSDEELVQLYNLCKLFVFPSWHEGFGLPALEAMACGAPVIGANATSLPEVIGLEEALFDPYDTDAMREKIQEALCDDVFLARLRSHGIARTDSFSWDVTAKRAIDAWQRLKGEVEGSSQKKVKLQRRPRLAFVTPLPPERTGIADYSAELVPALSEYYDIDVIVSQERVTHSWLDGKARVRDVEWLRQHVGELDRVIYQVGNSPFHQHMLPLIREIPGAVVLHDFFLSGLKSWLELHAGVEGAWGKALYDAHGYGAVQMRYRDVESAKREYPVNLDVLQGAQGIIVHSNYSRQLASDWYGQDIQKGWAVIPHLRVQAENFDKVEARAQLGFKSEDFVVCSFGFIDATKLNHRLLESWLSSSLARNERCHMVFVGENHAGEYGASLLQVIKQSGCGRRIRITGFASPELFRQYLMAADMAVQLRTQSRGETSGTVLDCMNHALPIIVNANGSMAELDRESLWMLSDDFDNGDLINAIETLWGNQEKRRALGSRAQQVIRERHSPAFCARQYSEAIERFHVRNRVGTVSLIAAIAKYANSLSRSELVQLSSSLACNLPLPRPAKRLYLDVTATCSNDLKTGIERVARSLVLSLLNSPPPGYRIEPVYLDSVDGRWCHRYARRYTLELLGCPAGGFQDEIIEPDVGDILLVLDLAGDALVKAEQSGLFSAYRKHGLLVYATVYDLLPIRFPEVFPPGADCLHQRWLKSISNFDGAVCISKAVADDFSRFLKEDKGEQVTRRSYRLGWFHLGADVANSAPTYGLPDNAESVLAKLRARPSFLMVGTIEPRKGYLQVIKAFTKLWAEDFDANLVIVGKEGWKGLAGDMRRNIPETIQCLQSHPERDKRLTWLEGISDEYLELVYDSCTCLIAASCDEGFGLPLIEAAQHGLPIIARDIAIFKEVAGEYASYFRGDSSDELAASIREWLRLYNAGVHPRIEGISWLTWAESACALKSALNFNP